MGYLFDPLLFSGLVPSASSSGVPIYANIGAFPAGSVTGQLGVAADTGDLYEWNGSAWQIIGGPADILSVGTIDSQTPSANGAVDHANQLILQSASTSVPGLVNNSAQTLSGIKSFQNEALISDGTNLLNFTLTTASSVTIHTGDVYTDGTVNFTVTANGTGVTSVSVTGTARPADNVETLTKSSGNAGSTASFLMLNYVDNLTPGLGFINETNSGIYRLGTDDWGMTLNGQTMIEFGTRTVGGVTGNVIGMGSAEAIASDPDTLLQVSSYLVDPLKFNFANRNTVATSTGAILSVQVGNTPTQTTLENWAYNTETTPYLTNSGALFSSPDMDFLAIGAENDHYTFTLATPVSITAGTKYTNNGNTYTISASTSSSTTLTATGPGIPQASGTLTFVSGSPSGNLTFNSYTTPGQIVFTVGGRIAPNEVFKMTSSQISTSNQLPMLTGDGTSLVNGFGFAAEPDTGWSRTGSLNPTLYLNAVPAIDVKFIGGGSPREINFGLGTTARSSSNNPLYAITSVNNTANWQFGNINTGSSTGTALLVQNGLDSNNVNAGIINAAYGSQSYYGGGSVVFADNQNLFLIMAAEYSAGYLSFNAGGLTSGTERMRITTTAIQSRNNTQFDANSTRIINVTDPTNPQDAATKNYIDTNFQHTVTIGALDAQAENANGLALVSNVLSAQSADGTHPGMVNITTQTLAGTKTFSSPVLHSSGSVSAPGIAFSAETNSGWYRIGSHDIALAVNGTLAIEINEITATQMNIGLGGAASASVGTALSAAYTYNGAASFNYSNLSQGASAQTQLYVGSGASGANGLEINNSAYNTNAYWGGGGSIQATANLSFLNISSENSSGYITFNTGAALASSNERLRLTNTALTIQKGTNLVLSGATSGALTLNAGATGTYSLTFPTAQGAANTTPQNDGSGNLSWVLTPTAASGDINQTSFTIANNQASAANVTGLAFANGSVESAQIQFSIVITATSNLYESGTIYLIQKGGVWSITQTSNFDNTNVVFSVTNAGQVQYTSPSYAGYSTGKMQFRATVTNV